MLQLTNISKSYAKGKVKAVDNFTLKVERGEIFGFIGPNGAGKTTTLKMIAGVIKPDEGDIFVDGLDIKKRPVAVKKRIGYVPDSQDIYERLSGREYLNFIADIYRVGEEERLQRTNKYLEMFGLEKAAGERIKTYSHGMKQKLLVAAALLPNPPLWLLDEPLVGLDPRAAKLLKDEMRAHCAEGNTVFFSTHVLEVAQQLCDRIAIIDNGKLVAVGTVEELKTRVAKEAEGKNLESIFLSLTQGGDNA